MAEASKALSVLVTGGAEGAGLATVKALLKRGHHVTATACDADGALAIRQAGALPVYPDLTRASELLSVLKQVKADAVAHAGPQYYGGAPQMATDADQLVAVTEALAQAASQHGLKRIVSLSFGYLYESGHGPAKEGAHDAHGEHYAPMLAAEAAIRASGLSGFILRAGYIYGGHGSATAALARNIKNSRRLPAGDQRASWIHEDDLASAIATLLEADADGNGIEILNAADGAPRSPDEFAIACCQSLGLSAPAIAGRSRLGMLRQKTFRDIMLAREATINSDALRERFGWQPKHGSINSGLEAAALVWRMQDAVNPDDFYNAYADKAAEAIENFAYAVALPEAVAEAEAPAPVEAAAPTPEAPKADAPPPPSAGPTPWNEDEAKREERRRRALERKAKRAAKQGRG